MSDRLLSSQASRVTAYCWRLLRGLGRDLAVDGGALVRAEPIAALHSTSFGGADVCAFLRIQDVLVDVASSRVVGVCTLDEAAARSVAAEHAFPVRGSLVTASAYHS